MQQWVRCGLLAVVVWVLTIAGSSSAASLEPLTGDGYISGVVRSATTPLSSVEVSFYNSSGYGWTALTDSQGQFTSPALPPGWYYVATHANAPYVNQAYLLAPCTQCYLQGSQVQVMSGTTTTGSISGFRSAAPSQAGWTMRVPACR